MEALCVPCGTFALGRGNYQERRGGEEERVSREKERKQRQKFGGRDFTEYSEKQRGLEESIRWESVAIQGREC